MVNNLCCKTLLSVWVWFGIDQEKYDLWNQIPMENFSRINWNPKSSSFEKIIYKKKGKSHDKKITSRRGFEPPDFRLIYYTKVNNLNLIFKNLY